MEDKLIRKQEKIEEMQNSIDELQAQMVDYLRLKQREPLLEDAERKAIKMEGLIESQNNELAGTPVLLTIRPERQSG